MKKIALLQPTYLPGPGPFQIMSMVDEFYYLINVQFTEPSWQHRNRIRIPFPTLDKRREPCPKCLSKNTVQKRDLKEPLFSIRLCESCGNVFDERPYGWIWLNVPTVHAGIGTPERLLMNTMIDNSKLWVQAHLASIGSLYKRSDYYETLYPQLEEIYLRFHEKLWMLNAELIDFFRVQFNIKTPLMTDAEVPYDIPTGHSNVDKTQRLVNFCIAVGADCYLEPEGGSRFIVPKVFERNGIELRYFHYDPPEYVQLFEDFVPYMSALDLLFCLGPRAKNKLKAEWFDTEIRENVTPEFDVKEVLQGGK